MFPQDISPRHTCAGYVSRLRPTSYDRYDCQVFPEETGRNLIFKPKTLIICRVLYKDMRNAVGLGMLLVFVDITPSHDIKHMSVMSFLRKVDFNT
jgi:hypothetical protein